MASLAVPIVAAAANPAAAAITHAATAQPISDAITVAATSTATYTVIAGDGEPNGTSDSTLAGFPTHGTTFGILTTGDVNAADDPNAINGAVTGDNAHSEVRGTDTVRDLTVLRIDGLRGGPGCRLSFEYRYLSEEYPDYVGTEYNDHFIAELDANSWTSAGGVVSAPNSFVIQSVNTSPMTAAEAAGTTYNGATPLLTATVPFTQTTDRSLFLSIADFEDAGLDSAVFIDKLGVICAAHVTIHRFPTGTFLLAAPVGWSCIDVNTNAVVTQGAALAQPDAGVRCTPPTDDAYCRSVVAGGYHAAAGTGSMTVTSACTPGPVATQTLQLPFGDPGVSVSTTGIGLFPWRCQMDDGSISADADVWMFCKVNLP